MKVENANLGNANLAGSVDLLTMKASRRRRAVNALREAEAITDGLLGFCASLRDVLTLRDKFKYQGLKSSVKH